MTVIRDTTIQISKAHGIGMKDLIGPGRRLSHIAAVRRRIWAILVIERGKKISDVARYFGVADESINEALRTHFGWQGHKRLQRAGRSTKVRFRARGY